MVRLWFYNANMQPQYYGAAATYNKAPKGPLSNRLFLIIGAAFVGIILLAVIFYLFTSLTSGSRNQAAALQLRHSNLQSFVLGNQKSIKNAELAKLNSDLGILLSSDAVSLQKQLTATYGTFDVPKEIIAAENDSTSKKKLTEAELINKFDIAYKQILEAKIASNIQLAEQVAASESGAFQVAVKNSIKNLKTITAELDEVTL